MESKFCFIQDASNLQVLDEIKIISESKSMCKIKGPSRLQTINEVNGNRRRYSMAICEHFVDTANAKINSPRGLCGELDHPIVADLSDPKEFKRQNTVEFKSASHKFSDVRIDGHDVVGIVETLSNDTGINMARLAVYDNIKIGFSGRAMGKVKVVNEGGNKINEVTMPAIFITWDAVSNPSHDTCNILDITEAILDTETFPKMKMALTENGTLNEDSFSVINTMEMFKRSFTTDLQAQRITNLINETLIGCNDAKPNMTMSELYSYYLDSSDYKTGQSKHSVFNESNVRDVLDDFAYDRKGNRKLSSIFKKYLG